MIKKLFVILMLFSINVFSQKFLFTENFSSGSLAGWKIYDETPSHDGPSNWLINDGCLVQNSNVWAYAAGTTEYKYYMGTQISTGDSTWSDYSLNTYMRSSDDDGIGILFRFKDVKNYYRMIMLSDNNNGGPFKKLQKIVNGEPTTLAEDKSQEAYPKGWFSLSILAFGDSIKAYMDSKLIFAVKDAQFSSGKIGFMCYANSGSYFDSVTVSSDKFIYDKYKTPPLMIDRLPYLQLPDTNSVSIAFCTKSKSIGSIQYGDDRNHGKTVTEDTAGYSHIIKIGGLNAGQKYYYKVLTNGSVFADNLYFHTVKPANNKRVNILLFGDSGTGSDAQYAIAHAMEKIVDSVDFAMHVGDVSQIDGSEYDNIYFKPYKNIVDKISIFTAIGNHDTYFDNEATYLSTFYLPSNNALKTKQYYSFRYGNAFIINMDSNIDYTPNSAQYKFLIDQLNSENYKTADWRLIYFHHPPYCEYWTTYDGEPNVRKYLVPLFEQYKMDYVFNGHTHAYERGQQNGVNYIITGGGGGDLDDFGRDYPQIVKSMAVHHYTLVNIDGLTLTERAIDANGKVVDSVTIHKNPSKVDDNKLTKMSFGLEQNYPNPFNPTTRIAFTLAKQAKVDLSVFNVLGQKVQQVFNGLLDMGRHECEFDAKNFSSGIYFYKLTSDESFDIKKMLLLK